MSDCLTRSIDKHLPTAPHTELIVVDNSRQRFPSAGAALNHGVTLAHNDVCVFVHQDVYLHSLIRLEEAAAALVTNPAIGLAGALGITSRGHLHGRIRDRVVLLGDTTVGFADVDSLDEVLFMARRDQLLGAPLAEDTDLAWHAYAVEYGARMARAGKRVVAGRIPLTHNSLTINLDRLEDAHAHVATRYPELLPLRTTCGVITGVPARENKFLGSHRWRYRWLKGSRRLHSARQALGRPAVVLSDIRFDVDNALESCGADSLTVVNMEARNGHDADLAEPIHLLRRERGVSFRVADPATVLDVLTNRERSESILLTNLESARLPSLRHVCDRTTAVLGFAESIGFWLIAGPVSTAQPSGWRVPSARPLLLSTR
ncbi:MAG: hypothetical protein JST91_07750 [Actinobacteria bacterium]|nr:hypothetical protein [Actinomycetota bacterium]